MNKQERNELTKLLEIEPYYLIDYLTDLIVENDEDIAMAIETKDRERLTSIIERYIY
jgi:hypothetical protein